MEKITLPPLPARDIEKLDQLLLFLKQNKTEFINIHSVCKEKWGDNRLLYLFFAEYLKKNSFTTAKNTKDGEKYVWKQMIAPRGLAFHGFKKEYNKQRQKKKKETDVKDWSKLKELASTALFNTSWLRFR